MGVAEIIPGISGGTIAFLLGIYQPFIQSIRSINSQFVKHLLGFRIGDALHTVAWKFLALLFAGMLLAILSLSHLLSWLIETHPTIIFSFFFGLILATGPIIARIVDKWTPAKVLVFLASGVATFFLVGMVPINTPDASWFILLCGAVAISAMIENDDDMPLRQYDKILFHPKNAIPVDFEPDNQLFVVPVDDVVAVFRRQPMPTPPPELEDEGDDEDDDDA